MNYKEFKKFVLEDPIIFNKFTIVVTISFIINCLIFPAMFFQMYKTFKRNESKDFNPFFLTFQLLGGAPEGLIGSVIGYMTGNIQQFIIGLYAMFYNIFMLYYRFFGKNGLLAKKKIKNKK
jgi:hypothetical protein